MCSRILLERGQLSYIVRLVNPNSTPGLPYYEEDILSTNSSVYILMKGVELYPFDQQYTKQLKRSHARLIVPLHHWKQFSQFQDLLQAHLASLSRCVLIIRLCIVALWVLYDLSMLLENSQTRTNSQTSSENLTFCNTLENRRFNFSGNTFRTSEGSAHQPTGQASFDGYFIWKGVGWSSSTKLLNHVTGGDLLGPKRRIALEYLWSDLIAIFILIYSVGLPFGFPERFQQSIEEAIKNMEQSDVAVKRHEGNEQEATSSRMTTNNQAKDRNEDHSQGFIKENLPINVCFLSGSLLNHHFTECPICCARFSKRVRYNKLMLVKVECTNVDTSLLEFPRFEWYFTRFRLMYSIRLTHGCNQHLHAIFALRCEQPLCSCVMMH